MEIDHDWERFKNELWEFVCDTFECGKSFRTTDVAQAAGVRYYAVRKALIELEKSSHDIKRVSRKGGLFWQLLTLEECV